MSGLVGLLNSVRAKMCVAWVVFACCLSWAAADSSEPSSSWSKAGLSCQLDMRWTRNQRVFLCASKHCSFLCSFYSLMLLCRLCSYLRQFITSVNLAVNFFLSLLKWASLSKDRSPLHSAVPALIHRWMNFIFYYFTWIPAGHLRYYCAALFSKCLLFAGAEAYMHWCISTTRGFTSTSANLTRATVPFPHPIKNRINIVTDPNSVWFPNWIKLNSRFTCCISKNKSTQMLIALTGIKKLSKIFVTLPGRGTYKCKCHSMNFINAFTTYG